MKTLILGIILGIAFGWQVAHAFPVGTPAERENGTALGLSEIGGFRVYCGAASGEYTRDMDYPAPEFQPTLPDTELPDPAFVDADTIYCVVTAYDKVGRESVFSNEATFVRDANYPPRAPFIPPGWLKKIIETLK